jgi:hypothetical protein
MKKLRQCLIGTTILGVLFAIGAFMTSSRAQAEGKDSDVVSVKIVSPLPVPVTGTTTLGGTVGATQSGPWNVGITGTPSVGAVQTGSWNVGITGTPTVRNADEPAREAFETSINLNLTSPTANVTIPAGKRLVIEYVTCEASAFSPTGQVAPSFRLTVGLSGTGGEYNFIPQGNTDVSASPIFFGSYPVRIYADTLSLNAAYRGFVPTQLNLNVSIAGYLVSVP